MFAFAEKKTFRHRLHIFFKNEHFATVFSFPVSTKTQLFQLTDERHILVHVLSQRTYFILFTEDRDQNMRDWLWNKKFRFLIQLYLFCFILRTCTIIEVFQVSREFTSEVSLSGDFFGCEEGVSLTFEFPY